MVFGDLEEKVAKYKVRIFSRTIHFDRETDHRLLEQSRLRELGETVSDGEDDDDDDDDKDSSNDEAESDVD